MASKTIVETIVGRTAVFCVRNYSQGQLDTVAEQWAEAFTDTPADLLQAAVEVWLANLNDRAPVSLPTVALLRRAMTRDAGPTRQPDRPWRKPDPDFLAAHRAFQHFAIGLVGREVDSVEAEQLRIRLDLLPPPLVRDGGEPCCTGGMVQAAEQRGSRTIPVVVPCRICEAEMFDHWYGDRPTPEGVDGKTAAAGR